MVDLRALWYQPTGFVSYKLRHSDEWVILPNRKSSHHMKPIAVLPKLFSSRRRIKAAKWDDLQSLKSVLPRDVHAFYDNLLY